jgi:hypothetical protein
VTVRPGVETLPAALPHCDGTKYINALLRHAVGDRLRIMRRATVRASVPME